MTATSTLASRPIRGRSIATATLWYVTAASLAVVMLFPIYWAIVSSLKTPAEAAAAPTTLLPTSFSTANFESLGVGGETGVLNAVLNSAIVTALTLVMTLVVSTLAGYAFSRFKFPGSSIAFVAILMTLMIPFQAIMIPLFVILNAIGLGNSLFGLALLYTTFQMPFSIFVMRNTFDQIPRELDEAAIVDGAGTVRTLINVLLPTAWPGGVTVLLFAFLAAWNELFAALIVLGDPSKLTMPIRLNLILANQYGTIDWGQLQAGVVVSMVPCLLIFILLQRYYVAGALAGSIKG